jgi:hypothetical protein
MWEQTQCNRITRISMYKHVIAQTGEWSGFDFLCLPQVTSEVCQKTSFLFERHMFAMKQKKGWRMMIKADDLFFKTYFLKTC